MKFSNRQIYPPMTLPESVRTNHPIIIRFSGLNHSIWAATLAAKRSGDFPVPYMAGWKTRPPVIDLSAEALAKVEAEARETGKALKEILEKIGV
ncbi:MAG: hypothetical protein WBJ41_01310 [Chromatiaceae bacterium]